jgi:transposase
VKIIFTYVREVITISSITKHHVGRYTYIYESTSFWDSNTKYPNNQKKCIGRIDPDSGEQFYKQEYIDLLKQNGKPTGNMKVWHDQRKISEAKLKGINIDAFTIAQEILGTVKSFGLAYFLQSIADRIGLVDILRQTLPYCWQKLLVLACYLVAENKPMTYCSDWVDENECPDVGNMASQRVSELLSAFGYNERSKFFKQWYQLIREKEYVALDITSVSSYSENIGLVEWGHNRDNERLPQINICMLFGQKSMMPIYQTIYSGSLTDVTTLETTLSEFEAITGTRDIMLVMDKGFYREKNVNKLLDCANRPPCKFLIPVSFTTNFANDHVENERASIDDVDNVIMTNEVPVRGVYRHSAWKKDIQLHTHIYYDPKRALDERNDIYEYVTRIKKIALKDHNDPKHQKGFQKYLAIDKEKILDGSISVEIRKEVIEKSLEHSGWLILISNQIIDTQEALDIYRAKDVVEKSFYQYKSNLGLHRLHVHSDERTQNKTFAAFIALILSSHIHKVMKDSRLDEEFSFGKLLCILSKLKIAYVNKVPVLQPLTKEQKTIFKGFNIELPNGSEEK